MKRLTIKGASFDRQKAKSNRNRVNPNAQQGECEGDKVPPQIIL